MDIINYEFIEGDDLYCNCQDCANLNSLERRKFIMSEDIEKHEKRMQYLNERSRLITSAQKDVAQLINEVEDLGQRIQQVKIEIEKFGEKKLSDLMN